MVTSAVGLLNVYEYVSLEDYLKNSFSWRTLTPYNTSLVRYVNYGGSVDSYDVANSSGGRPTINLKSNVVITGGDGTKENPFTVKLGS